ncbi:hypothetical protein HELRODRAFT_191744 [Helobdella robusta]|uniref:Apple domain-containing protein n=1 Tax=Helobdella robusta TaxID=6412 RepID=T1FT92_HELRO|nr:hypothetical protein HELRODRAFT_191744 [Helobdella robusta]ESO04193.1 hypothetical protein HELRODRAFT_191744 [Helobdella robusta]
MMLASSTPSPFPSPSGRRYLGFLVVASALLMTSLQENITCYKCDWGKCEGSTETCTAKAACYYAESGIGYKSCLCRRDLCNFAKPQNDIVFNEVTLPINFLNAFSKNLALNQPAASSSLHGAFQSLGAKLLVDGDANPDYLQGHCMHGVDGSGGPNWAVVDLADKYGVDFVVLYSRDCIPDRLDYFMIGLTSVDYFAPGSNVVRGTYPLCGQYKYQAVVSSKHTLKCNANLLPYRFVIVQQPITGPGSLTVCELEVYKADNSNSKKWNRYVNYKLTGYTSHVMVVSHKLKCFFNCMPGLCNSVNFKEDGSVCELNQHLFGYNQNNLMVSADWSFYEVHYA